MPKHKIAGLFTRLHEKFADSDTSPAQEALLLQLQSQLADWDGPPAADGNLVATAQLLLETLEEEHPQLSRLVQEILEAMARIGI
jgi:hypothetical protein